MSHQPRDMLVWHSQRFSDVGICQVQSSFPNDALNRPGAEGKGTACIACRPIPILQQGGDCLA
jgi:hypothetical protein